MKSAVFKKIKSCSWLEIFNSVFAYFSLALQTSTELSWMKCFYDKSDADDSSLSWESYYKCTGWEQKGEKEAPWLYNQWVTRLVNSSCESSNRDFVAGRGLKIQEPTPKTTCSLANNSVSFIQLGFWAKHPGDSNVYRAIASTTGPRLQLRIVPQCCH